MYLYAIGPRLDFLLGTAVTEEQIEHILNDDQKASSKSFYWQNQTKIMEINLDNCDIFYSIENARAFLEHPENFVDDEDINNLPEIVEKQFCWSKQVYSSEHPLLKLSITDDVTEDGSWFHVQSVEWIELDCLGTQVSGKNFWFKDDINLSLFGKSFQLSYGLIGAPIDPTLALDYEQTHPGNDATIYDGLFENNPQGFTPHEQGIRQRLAEPKSALPSLQEGPDGEIYMLRTRSPKQVRQTN